MGGWAGRRESIREAVVGWAGISQLQRSVNESYPGVEGELGRTHSGRGGVWAGAEVG